LVEALGFDPTTIDLDAFSQAWHSAWVLAGDKLVVALISGFAKDHIYAQHALEYSQAAGNAVFEVLLALLLAAATAGMGLAIGMASKALHAGEFGRVGRKLGLLAEALEGSPRGIVRRRGMTTRVVDGGGSSGRRGRVSQETVTPELQVRADKVAALPAKLLSRKPKPAGETPPDTTKKLTKETVEGRKVFQRDELIEPDRIDGFGKTNVERMQKGKAPIGPNGEEVNLHHLTQDEPGSMAEVGSVFHSKNDRTLHIYSNQYDKSWKGLDGIRRRYSSAPPSMVRGPFNTWKKKYWKTRANDFK